MPDSLIFLGVPHKNIFKNFKNIFLRSDSIRFVSYYKMSSYGTFDLIIGGFLHLRKNISLNILTT